MDIPALNAGLIDKGPDARGEYGAAEERRTPRYYAEQETN